jgi:hypothetical protein
MAAMVLPPAMSGLGRPVKAAVLLLLLLLWCGL